jgi:bifunctional DNA-binding transcriptional regulator/antitoxin component of YhaV-PrlF toxin-antitoxin module
MGEILFKRQISTTGKLSYVSFPEQALQALNMKPGDKVDLIIRDGVAVIRPREGQEVLKLTVSTKKQKARKR